MTTTSTCRDRGDQWPESLPVLRAKDIHRGHFDGPNGTHCLAGWVYALLHGRNTRAKFRDQLEHTLSTSGIVACPGLIPAANDNPANSKASLAKAWNDTLAHFGYTEIHYIDGDPE